MNTLSIFESRQREGILQILCFDGKICAETFELTQKIQLSSYNSLVWGKKTSDDR